MQGGVEEGGGGGEEKEGGGGGGVVGDGRACAEWRGTGQGRPARTGGVGGGSVGGVEQSLWSVCVAAAGRPSPIASVRKTAASTRTPCTTAHRASPRGARPAAMPTAAGRR